MPMDETARLLIATLAAQGTLTDEERTQSVRDLIADGMTIDDIRELCPALLGIPLSTPSRTASGLPLVAPTTLLISA